MKKIVFALALVAFSSQVKAEMTASEANKLAYWAIKKFHHISPQDSKDYNELVRVYRNGIISDCEKYGEELTVKAFKAIGHKVWRVPAALEGDKEYPVFLQFIADHGEKGFAVLNDSNARYILMGKDAQTALMRHGDFCVPFLKSNDVACIKALAAISTDSAKKLILISVEIRKNIQKPRYYLLFNELLASVAKHGDAAVKYCWQNHDLIIKESGLFCFSALPQAYLSGERDLKEDMQKYEKWLQTQKGDAAAAGK